MCVVQGHGILPSQKLLPTLPQNARYAFHENTCFDWGTFRWVMNQTISNLASYKYIIFMNSSVRGPHLPVYWPVSFDCLGAHGGFDMCIQKLTSLSARLCYLGFYKTSNIWVVLQAFVHWSTIFTSRLSNDIKLVGSTISCESTYLHGDTTAEKRQNPHVQSYVMATDQVSRAFWLDMSGSAIMIPLLLGLSTIKLCAGRRQNFDGRQARFQVLRELARHNLE